ncbi:MAG: hypothetical protein JO041_07175 [Acidobacteria bacterium]|nr:hypothetical protein [Acidobacteriota bacterium]
MKPTALRLLATSSAAALLLAGWAGAATRPHYGGTLRVFLGAAPDAGQAGSFSLTGAGAEFTAGNAGSLASLVFDTLVMADDNGGLEPGLALSWSSDAGFRRWQFRLRPGVKFHSGEPLTAAAAAASLTAVVPGCRASLFEPRPLSEQPGLLESGGAGESVVVECDAPHPELAAQMASPSAAISHRSSAGALEGTGPFRLSSWQPGSRAVFTAFEGCWAGRPYLDTIEITMHQDLRDQQLALQLGRADVVEASPGQPISGVRVSASAPAKLVALVFSENSAAVADERVRQAFSLAADRATIAGILLQGAAEPAWGVLPNWISGYEFLFRGANDEARARQLRAEARAGAPITVAVAASGDAQLRLVAERIVLNARDAGFDVQLTADLRRADAAITAVPLGSADPGAALVTAAELLRRPRPQFQDASLTAAWQAERSMLAGTWIVPIVHAGAAWALSPRVHDWAARRDGRWRLDEVWLEDSVK